ncbi:uncharacterized protein SOCE26_102260 [Sorangium cellulosum]|uniref:Uncharacterized protein n=1 Tax=Sorangium cellulosum TaxID=56 RepID=A0A2L0FAS5_SORCE|nr:uncharacterized protein SOCE26_102260 [Sorangium cellulosum]
MRPPARRAPGLAWPSLHGSTRERDVAEPPRPHDAGRARGRGRVRARRAAPRRLRRLPGLRRPVGRRAPRRGGREGVAHPGRAREGVDGPLRVGEAGELQDEPRDPGGLERLEDHVMPPALAGADVLVCSRDQQAARIGRQVVDPPEELFAVHPRHLEVGADHVELVCLEHLERPRGGPAGDDLDVVFEDGRDAVQHPLLVVDDEHTQPLLRVRAHGAPRVGSGAEGGVVLAGDDRAVRFMSCPRVQLARRGGAARRSRSGWWIEAFQLETTAWGRLRIYTTNLAFVKLVLEHFVPARASAIPAISFTVLKQSSHLVLTSTSHRADRLQWSGQRLVAAAVGCESSSGDHRRTWLEARSIRGGRRVRSVGATRVFGSCYSRLRLLPDGLEFAGTGYTPPLRALEGDGPILTWAALARAGSRPPG